MRTRPHVPTAPHLIAPAAQTLCCAAQARPKRPPCGVQVGSLLQLESCVLFVDSDSTVHVEVMAYVTQPSLRTSNVSNSFYFTFKAPPGTTLLPVIPTSRDLAARAVARKQSDAAQTLLDSAA